MAPCLLPKISEVKVTPSVTSVESSEQFWRKIRQIWRICEPCLLSQEFPIMSEGQGAGDSLELHNTSTLQMTNLFQCHNKTKP